MLAFPALLLAVVGGFVMPVVWFAVPPLVGVIVWSVRLRRRTLDARARAAGPVEAVTAWPSDADDGPSSEAPVHYAPVVSGALTEPPVSEDQVLRAAALMVGGAVVLVVVRVLFAVAGLAAAGVVAGAVVVAVVVWRRR